MTATTRNDTPVAIEGNGVELRTRDIGGDTSVSFVHLPAGTDMGPALKGMTDDLCQCPHWGYLFSGRLKMRTKDGDHVYEAGEAFYWPPGHAPEALEDCDYVDFSPTKEYTEVIEHVKAASRG
ncbi:hypothetical protein J7E93_20525 [Streptomyces sp. ISL-36]|uniref:hypothetical protein n=1 Tax=Streptomyces sp. ISL-36 TaxID=2819182 RepID=UPI001BED26EE|nr:hypothetical protein [Streptomyces sp. ISL-36]MBT2442450.1 hypothetical protein [Streptomyces sp. ISL-36]